MATSTTTAPPTTTTTTTVPPEPGWTVLATEATGVAVDSRAVTMPDGSTVTLIRFRAGQVHFDLHIGSTDPPTNGATLPATAGPAISPTEKPLLLAAFNGGFKVTTGAGGTEVDGQTLTTLVSGDASFVLDAGGQGAIGVWGQTGFPPAGLAVQSVRQNLPPLISNGVPAANVGQWTAWGATITHLSAVARSALGEDPAGDIVYAASMSTYPADLAQALLGVGVTEAMELDINPYWVQADVAPSPGAPLVGEVPGQQRPATQYESGWTRDFFTVLAGGSAPGA